MSSKFCACQCGTKIRARNNQGKRRGHHFASGHNTESARTWRSPDSRGDLIRKRGGRNAAPGRHAEKHSDFVPEPSAWYRARFEKSIGNNNVASFYKLSNGDRVFVLRELMPENAGETVLVRIESSPSDKRGARWKAVEVLAEAEETQ